MDGKKKGRAILRTIKTLLDAGADPNAAGGSEQGCTALHLAIKRGQSDVLELMLDYAADVAVTTRDGETALDLAEQGDSSDRQKIAELIRQAQGESE